MSTVHKSDGKRYIVESDELLRAFQLEASFCDFSRALDPLLGRKMIRVFSK